MLPPAAYTSPDVLAEEHRRIFSTEWSCVGRTADLPNRGDYLTAEIPSPTPHILTGIGRSSCCAATTGQLSAFDNVCVHRGSPLLHDCGNATRITCPYHAWVYRLDGQLIGAPYMNRTVDVDGKPFDPADHHLTALRLEEWEGFLFVTQDPDARISRRGWSGSTDVVGRYRMAGYVPVHRQVDVWDTNWKLLYENFMDAYHVFKVHKNSFAKNGDNTLQTTMHAGTDHFAYHLVGHDADAEVRRRPSLQHVAGGRLAAHHRARRGVPDARDAAAAGLAVVPATEPARHRTGADSLGRVGCAGGVGRSGGSRGVCRRPARLAQRGELRRPTDRRGCVPGRAANEP